VISITQIPAASLHLDRSAMLMPDVYNTILGIVQRMVWYAGREDAGSNLAAMKITRRQAAATARMQRPDARQVATTAE
jgi:hypothetical protein